MKKTYRCESGLVDLFALDPIVVAVVLFLGGVIDRTEVAWVCGFHFYLLNV